MDDLTPENAIDTYLNWTPEERNRYWSSQSTEENGKDSVDSTLDGQPINNTGVTLDQSGAIEGLTTRQYLTAIRDGLQEIIDKDNGNIAERKTRHSALMDFMERNKDKTID